MMVRIYASAIIFGLWLKYICCFYISGIELREIQTTPENSDFDIQRIQNKTEQIPEEPKPSLNKQPEHNCDLSNGPLM